MEMYLSNNTLLCLLNLWFQKLYFSYVCGCLQKILCNPIMMKAGAALGKTTHEELSLGVFESFYYFFMDFCSNVHGIFACVRQEGRVSKTSHLVVM